MEKVYGALQISKTKDNKLMKLNEVEDVISSIYTPTYTLMNDKLVIDDYETVTLLEDCANLKNLNLNLHFNGDYIVDLSRCENLKIFRCSGGAGMQWKIKGNFDYISILNGRHGDGCKSVAVWRHFMMKVLQALITKIRYQLGMIFSIH